jgi:hypothetical protein
MNCFGAWDDLEEMLAFYEAASASARSDADVGEWLSAAEVRRLAGGLRPGVVPPVTSAQGKLDLIGDPSRVTWTDNGWLPIAGCWRGGAHWTGRLARRVAEGHELTSCALLAPLWLKSRGGGDPVLEAAKDRTLVGFAQSGHVVPWRAEWGFPSVVVPIEVIMQNDKPRVFTDARYTNGAISAVDLFLPTVAGVAKGFSRRSWLAKADLKCGYNQLPMAASSRGLLAFIWRGSLWCFVVATLGLRDSPGVFQSHTEFVAACVMHRWPMVKVSVYLDDFIFCSDDEGRPPLEEIWAFMCSMGLVLGEKKCSAAWTRREIVLGIDVDIEQGTARLPAEKEALVLDSLERLELSVGRPPRLIEIAALVGRLCAAEVAIRFVYVMARPLMVFVAAAVGGSESEVRRAEAVGCRAAYRERCPVPPVVRAACAKLREVWHLVHGRSLRQRRITRQLVTDASETGAGGYVVDKDSGAILQEVAAPLPGRFIGESSLVRELAALRIVLAEAGPACLSGCRIEAVTDNRGVMCRVLKGVSARVAGDEAYQIALWCLRHKVELARSVWIPRRENAKADELSRKVGYAQEATIDPAWFAALLQVASPVPNIDAFASSENAVLPRFCSLEKPRNPALLDGLSRDWSPEDVPWLFPPPALLSAAVHNWRISRSEDAFVCAPMDGRSMGERFGFLLRRVLTGVRVLGAEPSRYGWSVAHLSKTGRGMGPPAPPS